MKILQINKFHWMKGGSEAAYLGVSRLLESCAHSVIPFSMQSDKNLPTPYDCFFVDNVDYYAGGLMNKLVTASKIIYSFDARRKMKALLKEVIPDIAHFHIFQHQISPSVFGPLRSRNIPLVLTLHDLKPICPNYKMLTHDGICGRCKGRKFYNCFLHRCTKGSAIQSAVNMVEMYFHYAMGYYQSVNAYIAVSRFYREKMIEFGFAPEKVTYVPNFVDVRAFSEGQADGKYGLFFGRLSEEKGVVTLLQALSLRPDIRFVIAGTGPEEVRLRTMAESLPNVRFVGFKTGDELRKLIEEASFSVVPSEWYENCPLSVLESLAAATPVIGSRIGGIPELIAEGRDGLTFTPKRVNELVEAMGSLWENEPLRREMGMQGRMKIKNEFTSEMHYEKTMAVYRRVLKG